MHNRYPNTTTTNYPFGMLIKERSFTSDSYRFGFNGMERDDEVKGEANSLEFKFRIYDSRLGKFLSVDPLFNNYPFYSQYAFAGNLPIWAIDLEGLEPIVTSGRLEGYIVKSGQGPISIAKDINNPETMIKYGYSLPIKITPADVINSNPEFFLNIKNKQDLLDVEFTKLKMKKGDKLSLYTFTNRLNKLTANTNEITSLKKQMNVNHNKIQSLKKEIIKVEEEAEEIKKSISEGGDGDMGKAGGYGAMGAAIVRNRKVFQLNEKIKKLEKANKDYGHKIQKLEKENEEIINQ